MTQRKTVLARRRGDSKRRARRAGYRHDKRRAVNPRGSRLFPIGVKDGILNKINKEDLQQNKL